MSEENERRKTAREEFEQARERYYQMRQQERDMRHQERDLRRQERDMGGEANQRQRERSRDERRSLRDEIRRGLHSSGFGSDLSHQIGRSIRESMSFNFDLADFAGGEEYSELVEREFTVGHMPRLHVHNVSGDTKITVGEDGKIQVKARKRVRGTSEERAKRLLENVEVRMDQEGDEVTLKPHLHGQDRG